MRRVCENRGPRIGDRRFGESKRASSSSSSLQIEVLKMNSPASTSLCPGLAEPQPAAGRLYLTVLTWAFTLFNSARVFGYLPTIWAVYCSGDSSQHSLFTWLTWLGANTTMAGWLYEQNGRRFDKAVAVNLCNSSMCLLVAALIVVQRLG